MSNNLVQTEQRAAATVNKGTEKPNGHLRVRLFEEAKAFLVVTLYLWAISLHKTIVLEQGHMNYQSGTFALVNAFILGKSCWWPTICVWATDLGTIR